MRAVWVAFGLVAVGCASVEVDSERMTAIDDDAQELAAVTPPETWTPLLPRNLASDPRELEEGAEADGAVRVLVSLDNPVPSTFRLRRDGTRHRMSGLVCAERLTFNSPFAGGEATLRLASAEDLNAEGTHASCTFSTSVKDAAVSREAIKIADESTARERFDARIAELLELPDAERFRLPSAVSFSLSDDPAPKTLVSYDREAGVRYTDEDGQTAYVLIYFAAVGDWDVVTYLTSPVRNEALEATVDFAHDEAMESVDQHLL
ncbi:MAG: hypothetical protein AAF830_01680 [Pseudomonadota bacterium]